MGNVLDMNISSFSISTYPLTVGSMVSSTAFVSSSGSGCATFRSTTFWGSSVAMIAIQSIAALVMFACRLGMIRCQMSMQSRAMGAFPVSKLPTSNLIAINDGNKTPLVPTLVTQSTATCIDQPFVIDSPKCARIAARGARDQH